MVYDVIVRTQLILESWQYESLKSIAEKRETSMSSVVREAVTRYLSVRTGEARLEDLKGLGSDARASGSRHDEHLYGGPLGRVKAGKRGPARRK